MKWPWSKPDYADTQEVVALILQSQENLLHLAQAMLSIVDNPDLVDDALRAELVWLIRDLTDSMAVLKEHVVV